MLDFSYTLTLQGLELKSVTGIQVLLTQTRTRTPT